MLNMSTLIRVSFTLHASELALLISKYVPRTMVKMVVIMESAI